MTKAANLAALGSVVTVPTGDAPSYQCRAWVNFNGTGTVAIRGSGNVSSITDNGVGLYTVNLTNAMPDTNYNVVAGADATFGVTSNILCARNGTFTTTSVGLASIFNNDSATTDVAVNCVSIFR